MKPTALCVPTHVDVATREAASLEPMPAAPVAPAGLGEIAVPRPVETTDYFPAFDWLRGLLACMVMLTHDQVIPWEHGADFAVEVFFALSGFLIGGILLRTRRQDLTRFFFNRSIRIWVPYYLAVALLVTVSLLRDPVTAKWSEFVTYKLTFVYNLFGPPQLATARSAMPLGGTGNHVWSVNAEEQFYLVAPLFLVLMTPRIGKSISLWALLAAVALWGHHYASIVFGVMASVVANRVGPPHTHRNAQPIIWLFALAGMTAVALDWRYGLVAPFAALSIVLLLASPGRQRPLGALVGGMSYPLYLNNWICVFIGNSLLAPFGLRNSPIRHVFSATAAIALAVALYWFVDRQLLRQRRTWFTTRRAVLITVVAYTITGAGLIYGLVTAHRHRDQHADLPIRSGVEQSRSDAHVENDSSTPYTSFINDFHR